MKHHFPKLALIAVMICLLLMLTGCSDSQPKPTATQAPTAAAPADPNAAFVFTGETTANTGRLLHMTLKGLKDDAKTVEVSIKEMPLVELGGTYKFVEGKGYIVYLNDGNDTFAYSEYDPATKSFGLQCYIDMGSYGMQKVSFTGADAAFADQYDGVGLGKTPPAFLMNDGWGGGVQKGSGKLVCAEDGTATASATVAAGWFVPRTGTWTYEEANNRYVVTFTDDYDLSDMEPNGVTDINIWTGSRQDADSCTTVSVKDVLDPENYNSFKGPLYAEYNAETGTYQMKVNMIWTWGAAKEEIAVFTCEY